jgi:hypothetical protein
MSRHRFPCTQEKACHILYLVNVQHLSQTHAALLCGLNVGTVCHVVHRRRFPGARPTPPPGFI